MRYQLVNAEDLQSRLMDGDDPMQQLRPVLAGNENPFASNATLRKDEWETIDDKVNEVMRERLTVVDDLRSRGLVQPVGLGAILRVTERLEQTLEAEVTYDGDTAPKRDRPSYLRDTIPVPVISTDFQISWRQLEASRTRGEPLDVTAAAAATRRVRDKQQDLVTNGFGTGPSGNAIPGLVTAANRQEVSLTTGWDASGATVIEDVLRLVQAAYAVNLFGPFYLYVPKNYWAALQEDYSTEKGDRTFIQRILAFEDIEQVRPLGMPRQLDALPARQAGVDSAPELIELFLELGNLFGRSRRALLFLRLDVALELDYRFFKLEHALPESQRFPASRPIELWGHGPGWPGSRSRIRRTTGKPAIPRTDRTVAGQGQRARMRRRSRSRSRERGEPTSPGGPAGGASAHDPRASESVPTRSAARRWSRLRPPGSRRQAAGAPW